MKTKQASNLPISETELYTWFERDRAHVELRDRLNGETIVEWWDDAVNEAIEDGFLNPRDYHASAYEYAVSLGLARQAVEHETSAEFVVEWSGEVLPFPLNDVQKKILADTAKIVTVKAK